MLRAASSATNQLLEAGERVVQFLREQFNQDGGARDRSGKSDLYYTVFALDGLLALGGNPPLQTLTAFLQSFDDGRRLDFVHCACLARCWSALPNGDLDPDTSRRILARIESYRSSDGGYGPQPGAPTGAVYHCFLALGAYQDLDQVPPVPKQLARCCDGLRTADGAYANQPGLSAGTTPATAAAATLMRQLGLPVPASVTDWLQNRAHADGGFLATPQAPLPDLLSTATALHALAGAGVSLDQLREPGLDFLDSLWTGRAFRGHWADQTPDSEYTFYALLALGHLSS